MKTYEIPNLSDKTPEKDRTKLITAFTNVAGVQSASLNLSSRHVEITGQGQKEPSREAIASAASKAGFPLAGPK